MKKSTPQIEIPQLPFSMMEAKIRGRIRETIEEWLDEELDAALGAGRHERAGSRRGYRHGSRPARTVVTTFGETELVQPRARLKTAHVKLALRPLFKGTAMSKSSVSRVVRRLGEHFEAWRGRDLSSEHYVYLIADAMRLPVRLARRVVKVPVQAVLGVREDGEKELLELRIAPSESLRAWQGVMEGLASRGLPALVAVVIDGNKGLVSAVERVWPETEIQRCTKHKLDNLVAAGPAHAHDEIKRDYHAIVDATDLEDARKAYRSFVRKWEKGKRPTTPTRRPCVPLSSSA